MIDGVIRKKMLELLFLLSHHLKFLFLCMFLYIFGIFIKLCRYLIHIIFANLKFLLNLYITRKSDGHWIYLKPDRSHMVLPLMIAGWPEGVVKRILFIQSKNRKLTF